MMSIITFYLLADIYVEHMGYKHNQNPVIDGSSRDPTQSYPPTVVKIDGTYYCVTKTEATDLVGFVSSDGVNWREKCKHTLKCSNSGWDRSKVSLPLLRFDPEQSEYHLYYTGRSPDGTAAVGHAISENPLTDYTKTIDNPLCKVEDINNKLNSQFTQVSLSDIIKTSDEYLFFGTARSADDSIIWIATGKKWTDIRDFEILFRAADLNFASILQTPSIVSVGDYYLMQFTAGENAVMLDERRLYLATGKTPFEFDIVSDPILVPGPEGSWDERRVYTAQWLKQQDGQYTQPELENGSIRLYYSGHDLGHHTASWVQKSLQHISIGSYPHLENQPLWKIVARVLLTRSGQHMASVFDYNRGYTGLAEYAPSELEQYVNRN